MKLARTSVVWWAVSGAIMLLYTARFVTRRSVRRVERGPLQLREVRLVEFGGARWCSVAWA